MAGEPARGTTWAVIAGGGTAGHVLPGLAIAHELVARGHPIGSIHYVGSERGIEAELVPPAGFGLTLLPGRGIQRRLALANVGAVIGLMRAALRAFWLVRRLRPSVVVSLGGYASVPCALAAIVWRVPVVVAEQNAVPGAANRLVARFAKASAVSFPETALPRAIITGNPVRAEVLAVDRARDRGAARAALGIRPERSLLLAFGGSLGSLRINRAVAGAVTTWHDRRDLAVRHAVGARDWDVILAEAPAPSDGAGGTAAQYQLVRYEDDMPRAYAAADLVLSRAGASTIAELAAVGLPSILVPLPGAPGDHQTANARFLEHAGAAVVVPDGELDAARLCREVDALVQGDRLPAMAAAATGSSRRDAATRVAKLVEEHARRG